MAPYRSDPALVVLHGLRCVGAAPATRVADAVRLPLAEVESELIDLGIAGLVGYTRGAFAGWALTDAGRGEVAARLARELAESGTRAAVERAHEDFGELNPKVLEACTDWQLRSRLPSELNDHTDPGYDAQVLRRLAALDDLAQRLCADLSGALTRFHPYGARLASALDRARAGDTAAVTDRTDSYHSVWFQLHEDLLVSLGIPRW
ncbi:MAG: transcriptional regulator [Propionicimonas sp.]|nr:transcriptional regulator [Propionicimonas sp.]